MQVSWNRLDFLLLVLGLLDLVLSMLQSNFLRILRVFRIQRLIALVSNGGRFRVPVPVLDGRLEMVQESSRPGRLVVAFCS